MPDKKAATARATKFSGTRRHVYSHTYQSGYALPVKIRVQCI